MQLAIKAIIDTKAGGNQSEASRLTKIDAKTLNRIYRGLFKPNLETLETFADAYGYEAWQLLVPGFDPNKPPKLKGEADIEATIEAVKKALISGEHR